MPNVDITGLGIRVILDPHWYNEPIKGGPIDTEGTVIYVSPHNARARDMINENLILELVCDHQYRGLADIFIRWDNDERSWFGNGYMKLRRAKIGFCVNIWNPSSIKVDTRPYHEMKGRSWTPEPETKGMFVDEGWVAEVSNKLYNGLRDVPRDGFWHMCKYQGVLSRVRGHGNVFEVQEDSIGAEIRYVDAPPRAKATTNYYGGGRISKPIRADKLKKMTQAYNIDYEVTTEASQRMAAKGTLRQPTLPGLYEESSTSIPREGTPINTTMYNGSAFVSVEHNSKARHVLGKKAILDEIEVTSMGDLKPRYVEYNTNLNKYTKVERDPEDPDDDF